MLIIGEMFVHVIVAVGALGAPRFHQSSPEAAVCLVPLLSISFDSTFVFLVSDTV